MKPKLLIFILFIVAVSSNTNAQKEILKGFPEFTEKGNRPFGLNYRSFALTWFISENKSIVHSAFNPLISYYVRDKLVLNI